MLALALIVGLVVFVGVLLVFAAHVVLAFVGCLAVVKKFESDFFLDFLLARRNLFRRKHCYFDQIPYRECILIEIQENKHKQTNKIEQIILVVVRN